MEMHYSPLYIVLLILLVTGPGCNTQDDIPPVNPFDIDIPEPPIAAPEPDSASLLGLHQYIFSKSCAVPGCHDGSFEPDFRSPQSAYNTLVFHPVIKNTPQASFDYRVLPFDVNASWLYNRVTTEDQVLGRMPLYDNALSQGQLKAIRDWINAGAPDLFGNVSAQPNTQPRFLGVAAFLEFGQIPIRVDTIRDDVFAPFGVLNNRNLSLWFSVEDDSTQLADLKNSQVLFSSDLFDFDHARRENLEYTPNPLVIPDFNGPGESAEFHWKVTLNTRDFPTSALTYFRYSVEDGSHSEPFVFPNGNQGLGFQFYASFFVAP